MAKRCYYKPKRTKPRLWETCSVARVAAEAVKNGSLRDDVLYHVAIRLGYRNVWVDDGFGRRSGTIFPLEQQIGSVQDLATPSARKGLRLPKKVEEAIKVLLGKLGKEVLDRVVDKLDSESGRRKVFSAVVCKVNLNRKVKNG